MFSDLRSAFTTACVLANDTHASIFGRKDTAGFGSTTGARTAVSGARMIERSQTHRKTRRILANGQNLCYGPNNNY
eukprot:5066409-Amphidinium_carterae.1